MFDINAVHFKDENEARKYLEALRWPGGPVCPHCGAQEGHYHLKGQKHRPGLWKCKSCRKQFSVTVGTVFERSKIPLTKWLLAVHLMCSSKKGISAHQLHRTLGVTYKSAWFMAHRVRLAMEAEAGPFGVGGRVVEADETYFGRKTGRAKERAGWGHKQAVFSLVERGGKVRSQHVSGKMFDGVKQALKSVSPEAHLMTDTAKMYNNLGKQFASHGRVNHFIKEYARGDVHTNTIEGFFSVFKRGMKGVYQHCREHHLHRYLSEFDFRYNNRAANGVDDIERTENALRGISGKRLVYQRPG